MQNDMRDRLIELLERHCLLMLCLTDCTVESSKCSECLADHLIENGVIVPPVKLGDVLYFLTEEEETDPFTDEFIPAGSVDSFLVRCIYADDWGVFVGDAESLSYRTDDFGKTVFLTREAAEQALKERESNA